MVRYIVGLGNADLPIVCPGRFGVGGSRDATAKAQEAVWGIGSLLRCSGHSGRLQRLVGAILGITRVLLAFDLVWNHSGAVLMKRSQDILTPVRRLRLWQMIRHSMKYRTTQGKLANG